MHLPGTAEAAACVRDLAVETRRVAAEVSELAERLRASSATGWTSTAAEAFHARVRERAHEVDRAAAQVDHLARALVRHARAVEDGPLLGGLLP